MVTYLKDNIAEECEELWRLYGKYIRCFCANRFGGDTEYIDDCVQEVFTAFIEAKRNGTEIRYPKAWLTTVADNKVKEFYRKSKAETEHIVRMTEESEFDELCTFDNYDFSAVSDREVEEMKQSVLKQLKKDEQVILNDYYVKRMKIKEIAAECDLSESNVKQKLFRARKDVKYLSQKEMRKRNI